MVERAVSICYIPIYAPLRGEVFTSLKQLNRAIKEKLDGLNTGETMQTVPHRPVQIAPLDIEITY
jgi:hypothetical protein